MAHRYELPTVDDLLRLAEPRDAAITVYTPTSPAANERDVALTAVKSAVDTAIRDLREGGLRHGVETALRAQWDAIGADGELWGNLASSLAVFISPDDHDVYVLPNDLEPQQQVSTFFDLGQLVRAVESDQYAYALQLSANAWRLWEATPTARATELTLTGTHPSSAADATNRDDIRGRQHERRLVGDEGKKVLLEAYAGRIAEAVVAELGDRNPASPLFVFASEPLLSMFSSAYTSRDVVPVPGAADELRPHQIDEAVRERLPQLSAQRVSAQLERIGNDVTRGLVSTDLAEIARATAAGAVDVLVYEFTVDILGTYDDVGGSIALASGDTPGYDLLSRIAIEVRRRGGEVIPVRDSEVSGGVWNGTAVAHLRYAL